MKLKQNTSKEIVKSLKESNIQIALDGNGNILVHEYRMDTRAKAGMISLKPASLIPEGALPFLVTRGENVYGVFHKKGEALIIEVGLNALDGDITDYYEQS